METLKSEPVHIRIVGKSFKPETNHFPSYKKKGDKWYAVSMGKKDGPSLFFSELPNEF